MINELTYSSPATEWTDGLPIGNGTIGAMIWGTAGQEVLTLNHNKLFRAKIKKDIKTAHLIPQVRKLMLQGKTKEAEEMFNNECRQYPDGCNPYQVFAQLMFETGEASKATGYSRNLNMRDAVANIGYTINGVRYYYCTFASINHNLLITKLTADKKVGLDFKISLSRPEDTECEYKIYYTDDCIYFEAEFDEGVKFSSNINVITNGDCLFETGNLIIKNADVIELRQSFATSYDTDDVNSRCKELLQKAESITYEQLLSDNIEANRILYDRVTFSLGNTGEDKSTDELYDEINSGKQIDNAVYQALFNSARFYTMCSSRGDSMPMNLQGIWNDSINPMWECGFTTDLNIQMHHWLTLPANLAECQMPLFKWLKSKEEVMRKQAKNVFGCGGYYIPQYTDNAHTPTCWYEYAMFQVLWSGGASWLAQHFYEYWKYTGDMEFLHNYALPYMKGCAEFYIDFLVQDENGKYISLPSLSPENTTTDGDWLVNTSTIDISLVNELFGNLIRLDDELKLNEKDRARWEDIIRNIKPYPINQDGVLEEWVEQVGQSDPYHRHLSHIYGLFPSKMFSETEDKTLYNASVKALEKRISGGFDSAASWSHAWYACCYARIGNGDKALECIENLLRCGTLPNFLTTHNDWREQGLSNQMIDYKLIQIDALLGAATSITEMFVQSFDGFIKIAPAIPKKWQKSGGEVSGLKTYGGHEVSFKWNNDKLTDVKIKWNHGNECKLMFGMEYEGYKEEK